MYKRRETSLRVCALGFDSRSHNALKIFFRAQCGDKVSLAGDDEADISIIDMDSYNAAKILTQQREQHPDRFLILVSLEQQSAVENAVSIKKPVQIQHMLDALALARSKLTKATTDLPVSRGSPKLAEFREKPQPAQKPTPENVPAQTKVFVAPVYDAKSTGQAAALLDENGFKEYIGALHDIDPINPAEVKAAQYDPKRYLQGYLQSAYKTALSKNTAVCLNTGWKPITIFPYTREVWVDADDQQLRSFCLVPVHSISELGFTDTTAGVMTLSPASANEAVASNYDTSKLQRMDALLWKIALWTSAGRIPEDIDLHRPVYLRNWPNLTRLLVFPNAIRIAALLSEQPRSLLDVTETLNVRQQYVFAFFSAARALGLADQAVRQSENLIAPPPIEPRKNTGVLKKILQRLLRR